MAGNNFFVPTKQLWAARQASPGRPGKKLVPISSEKLQIEAKSQIRTFNDFFKNFSEGYRKKYSTRGRRQWIHYICATQHCCAASQFGRTAESNRDKSAHHKLWCAVNKTSNALAKSWLNFITSNLVLLWSFMWRFERDQTKTNLNLHCPALASSLFDASMPFILLATRWHLRVRGARHVGRLAHLIKFSYLILPYYFSE